MDYLTRWHMLRVAYRFMHSPESVVDIAIASGYESESPSGRSSRRSWGFRRGNTVGAGRPSHWSSTRQRALEVKSLGLAPEQMPGKKPIKMTG